MTDRYEIGSVVVDMERVVRCIDRANKKIFGMEHKLSNDSIKEEIKNIKVLAKNVARDWFAEKMQGQSCVRCGYKGVALVPHHKDPRLKTDDISTMVRQGESIKTLETEWDKCIIVCQNCHFEIHLLRSKH
jgi:ribosomal protein L30E